MSRIQDILAKAERDGTARATQAGIAEPPAPAVVARIPIPLVDPVEPSPAVGPLGTIANSPLADVQPGIRTARPTLHHALVSAIAPHSNVAERYRALRARIGQREE